MLVEIDARIGPLPCNTNWIIPPTSAAGNFVSTIAIKAAKAAGLDTALCAAGGFYYRIGQWQKHKSVMEGVEQALAMHFPEKLTNILYEYYGKLRHPQTPESLTAEMENTFMP